MTLMAYDPDNDPTNPARDYIACLRQRVVQAEARAHKLAEALRPFAACIFDDNGDVTISTGSLSVDDYKRARKALRS